MAHEDRHVFAVWSPNMATAVMAINETETFDILHHIVPDGGERGGYWLLYKDDSMVKDRWKRRFPDALTLPR